MPKIPEINATEFKRAPISQRGKKQQKNETLVLRVLYIWGVYWFQLFVHCIRAWGLLWKQSLRRRTNWILDCPHTYSIQNKYYSSSKCFSSFGSAPPLARSVKVSNNRNNHGMLSRLRVYTCRSFDLVGLCFTISSSSHLFCPRCKIFQFMTTATIESRAASKRDSISRDVFPLHLDHTTSALYLWSVGLLLFYRTTSDRNKWLPLDRMLTLLLLGWVIYLVFIID